MRLAARPSARFSGGRNSDGAILISTIPRESPGSRGGHFIVCCHDFLIHQRFETGPWFPLAATTPTIAGKEIAVTVKATDTAKYFRLQSP
jgi:hypothetical protein